MLDTHALLWWLDGDKRLPLRVRRIIQRQGPQECRDRIARSEQRRRFAVAAASASAATTTGLDDARPPADFVHRELRNLQRLSALYGCGVGSPMLRRS